MKTNYPPKPQLTLNLDGSAPFEVECTDCDGRGWLYIGHGGKMDCHKCHGTGVRKVRPVGGVGGVCFYGDDDPDSPNGQIRAGFKWQSNDVVDWDGFCCASEILDAMIEWVIEQYRAGTLPPSLMAGDEPGDWRLKIVEVTDNE